MTFENAIRTLHQELCRIDKENNPELWDATYLAIDSLGWTKRNAPKKLITILEK